MLKYFKTVKIHFNQVTQVPETESLAVVSQLKLKLLNFINKETTTYMAARCCKTKLNVSTMKLEFILYLLTGAMLNAAFTPQILYKNLLWFLKEQLHPRTIYFKKKKRLLFLLFEITQIIWF